MRKLQYRAPRIPVDLPVRVTQGDLAQMMRCRDLSVDGMKLDLNGASFPYSSGSIQLMDGTSSLELSFQVRSRAVDSIGIVFHDKSIEQSEALSRLIASLSRRNASLSLVVRMPAS
jgi:hypothetical protein